MEAVQTPTYQSPVPPSFNSEMSVKDWMITMLITCIPLVGIIMLFVWAFGGDNSKPSRSTWAKAALLWALIITVLYMVIAFMFFGALFSAANL